MMMIIIIIIIILYVVAAFHESPRQDITWGGGKASGLHNLGTT
jgi:hypothetical protein